MDQSTQKKATRAKKADAPKEAEIAEWVLSHWSKDLSRDKMAELMQTDIAWEGRAPRKEVLKKKISKYRPPHTETPEDQLWRLSSISRPGYEIPPEALPRVLEILFEKLTGKPSEPPTHITIRQALWIGRLSHVTDDNNVLWEYAQRYANAERIFEVTKYDLTTITDDGQLYKDAGGKGS